MVFLYLDFIYVPAPLLEETLPLYTKELGGKPLWRVRAMGTIVAQAQLAENGPAILFAEHLEGSVRS
ncbi:MAG: hypothetical protein HY369_03810 [Candidatus Aenigmarchaeota archaeon]|nr:hypothetical protein [Candidatus Aenigmarchaeota archaeon]